jgi:hypothetical protein
MKKKGKYKDCKDVTNDKKKKKRVKRKRERVMALLIFGMLIMILMVEHVNTDIIFF